MSKYDFSKCKSCRYREMMIGDMKNEIFASGRILARTNLSPPVETKHKSNIIDCKAKIKKLRGQNEEHNCGAEREEEARRRQ